MYFKNSIYNNTFIIYPWLLALIDFNGAKIDVRWTRGSKIHFGGCQALLGVTDYYEHYLHWKKHLMFIGFPLLYLCSAWRLVFNN